MEPQAPTRASSGRPPLCPQVGGALAFRTHSVNGPKSASYFTLSIAADAGPVPPLPSMPPTPSPHRPQSISLKHRWRFLNREDLSLLPTQREVSAAASTASTRHSARSSPLPPSLCQLEKERSSRTIAVNEIKKISQRNMLQPKQGGICYEWLDSPFNMDAREPLHHDQRSQPMSTTCLGVNFTPVDDDSIINPNALTLPGHFHLSDATESTEVGASTETFSIVPAVKDNETNPFQTRDASAVTTVTADAAERLRVTLLTSAFQRMVHDVVEKHEYNDEERIPILRHANIFRELPLQSRYYEMHPLCNIRVASPFFRPGRETTTASSVSLRTTAERRRLGVHSKDQLVDASPPSPYFAATTLG